MTALLDGMGLVICLFTQESGSSAECIQSQMARADAWLQPVKKMEALRSPAILFSGLRQSSLSHACRRIVVWRTQLPGYDPIMFGHRPPVPRTIRIINHTPYVTPHHAESDGQALSRKDLATEMLVCCLNVHYRDSTHGVEMDSLTLPEPFRLFAQAFNLANDGCLGRDDRRLP